MRRTWGRTASAVSEPSRGTTMRSIMAILLPPSPADAGPEVGVTRVLEPPPPPLESGRAPHSDRRRGTVYLDDARPQPPDPPRGSPGFPRTRHRPGGRMRAEEGSRLPPGPDPLDPPGHRGGIDPRT